MTIEEKIEECEFNLNQIKHFDPDPFYVNYFFKLFIESVIKAYKGIFEEANYDFGLFILGNCNKEKFLKKALLKKDPNALKFVNWFEKENEIRHKTAYPNFIKNIIEFKNEFNKLPKTKIMIRAKERYPRDINLEIKLNLINGKLNSLEELDIEIKRNLPIFLEITNHKRILNDEPKIGKKEVTVSACMQNKEKNYFEIAYASEIYISVLKQFLKESREKINEITKWK